jgi:hypothetical protein
MAGNMESVMAKERKMFRSWGKHSFSTLQYRISCIIIIWLIPESMGGNMESVIAKERKI